MATVQVNQSDVSPGQSKVVDVDGKPIALFNVDGTFYAIDNTCQHSGGPLGEGALDGAIVTCPWHGWEYDVTNGVCQLDETVRVSAYPVRVEGEQVLIEVSS
jgi:nitrite reductase (NADH) small subunit